LKFSTTDSAKNIQMEREFLFRNNLKEDAHRVTSLLENNIQNKVVNNEGLSDAIKNSNSLTTTKMILSTHRSTETTLPVPEYNTRFTTTKTKTASSSSSSSTTKTTRPTHFLSQKPPKVSFFYLEDIYAPTRNYLLASKYVKTTTPHYLSSNFHFKDYMDMTEIWSDKYDGRKTFKNDFDDFYENY
jgi:hypothetical protein